MGKKSTTMEHARRMGNFPTPAGRKENETNTTTWQPNKNRQTHTITSNNTSVETGSKISENSSPKDHLRNRRTQDKHKQNPKKEAGNNTAHIPRHGNQQDRMGKDFTEQPIRISPSQHTKT